jgi:hypothetical protein
MKFLIEITENGFTKVSPVPARMGMGEASALLGISKTDLAHLCATGELELIGKPERNQERFLYADDVFDKARDKGWLTRITNVLYGHHGERNGKEKPRQD